jgi:hypothetical protein
MTCLFLFSCGAFRSSNLGARQRCLTPGLSLSIDRFSEWINGRCHLTTCSTTGGPESKIPFREGRVIETGGVTWDKGTEQKSTKRKNVSIPFACRNSYPRLECSWPNYIHGGRLNNGSQGRRHCSAWDRW